jgi:hypothetical protein
MQLALDKVLKIIGVSFVAGSTIAAFEFQLANKAGEADVRADSIVVHTQIDYMREDIQKALRDLTYELQRANERLRDICLKTQAGCQ